MRSKNVQAEGVVCAKAWRCVGEGTAFRELKHTLPAVPLLRPAHLQGPRPVLRALTLALRETLVRGKRGGGAPLLGAAGRA